MADKDSTMELLRQLVRLDPHTTKNDEGRTFPFTDVLQQLLVAQKVVHDQLRSEGVLCPWVFHRTGKKVKGKRIVRFTKAWRKACEKAGCPGRIPHDLRVRDGAGGEQR